MKKLMVVLVMSSACTSSPKLKAGDCVLNFLGYRSKVLSVGETTYRILEGSGNVSFKAIVDLDESLRKPPFMSPVAVKTSCEEIGL